jgi:Uma2 family endonuclease
VRAFIAVHPQIQQRQTQTVEVYRANHTIQVLTKPTELSAMEIMPGFVLKLAGILE